ncbi:integrase core domain-containing protein [Fuerstiella marisgermanici]|uniref:integrase core domain-containing protein n=1 Tax=Fuerstiella marisgermanici TaxID=1891926 RepID=UPI00097CAD7C
MAVSPSEGFNSKLRDEFLNVEEFESVRDAVQMTKQFQRQYNEVRSHSALDYQTPNEYAAFGSSSTDGSRPDHLRHHLDLSSALKAEATAKADGAQHNRFGKLFTTNVRRKLS